MSADDCQESVLEVDASAGSCIYFQSRQTNPKHELNWLSGIGNITNDNKGLVNSGKDHVEHYFAESGC